MLYRFENVEKSYGVHDVLKGASWQHNPGERVGLVGRNGAGKTTLFRIVLKQEDPDRGNLYRASGLRIGHLSQHLDASPDLSLFDFVLGAFSEVLAIETKMRELEHAMAEESAGHDRLLERYADLQHDYEHADGYTIHSEVERVLSGLGFNDRDEWVRPITQFSGGQQNRAMLARLLLAKVDVLLLDEPTNHLDLRGIEFLEEFLQSYKGSYLVVSHDRTFLNRTTGKIVELTHGKLIEYHGNYDRFVEQRAERHEQMRTEWERQQGFIEKTEDFIRRNIAGQKTKQAQSRRKMLAKIEQLERPQTDQTLAKFSLDAGPRSGVIALSAARLSAGYEGRKIVGNFSLVIRRGERYAIMGPNGAGKSTLLKTFAGRLEPLSGEVTFGHNVQVGYYDQTLGDLSLDGEVVDEIWNLDHSKSEEEVRNYLARFSFFADDVNKIVRSLSGGERGRLALAKIMYVGGNLLLLDEPTNHLDVYTREALEEALENFTGALVVVSHDRYFVDRIAESLIVVEDGEAEVHGGNYSDLVEKIKQENSRIQGAKGRIQVVAARTESSSVPVPSRDEQKKRERRLRKIEQDVAALEAKISDLERRCMENDTLLCDEEIYRDGARMRELQSATGAMRSEIDTLLRQWDDLSREREELAGSLDVFG